MNRDESAEVFQRDGFVMKQQLFSPAEVKEVETHLQHCLDALPAAGAKIDSIAVSNDLVLPECILCSIWCEVANTSVKQKYAERWIDYRCKEKETLC